jgi:hypothetical protein
MSKNNLLTLKNLKLTVTSLFKLNNRRELKLKRANFQVKDNKLEIKMNNKLIGIMLNKLRKVILTKRLMCNKIKINKIKKVMRMNKSAIKELK